jgi:hypothetical protein
MLTFPGGMSPSPAAFCAEAERAGLCVVEQLAFGQDDYATRALSALSALSANGANGAKRFACACPT